MRKTITGKPWFKNHWKPSFYRFSRETFGKQFCPILGHNSMKTMNLPTCICCQSCQSSMCRLHFSHLLYWFTEAEGGEWVLAALRMSNSCKMKKKCKGGRNAKFWEWNDNVQYNTWRVALLNDTRLVKIIQNPAKMLNPLFQHSEWHHSSTALLKSTLRRWNSAHHCCVGVPGYRACHVNLV